MKLFQSLLSLLLLPLKIVQKFLPQQKEDRNNSKTEKGKK